jgi:flagellar hook protein FlgE
VPKDIQVDLGTPGLSDGITQCGTNAVTQGSTATASGQDGYTSGWLKSLSISQSGMVEGVFDNGIRRDIAQIQLATFQNSAGLLDIGSNYFVTSANSGVASATSAGSNGAGAIQGQSLEKSNVDVATEFVNLIQAQNGFQANARTIKVSNDMMTELTSLLR